MSDELAVQWTGLCMKSDYLQGSKVALHPLFLLKLDNPQEEGPHWSESAVHQESV